MKTNQLLTIVQRKRSPLIQPDPPKPLEVGDVCPHCGRVVAAEPNAEPLAPVEIPKPIQSRDDDTTY